MASSPWPPIACVPSSWQLLARGRATSGDLPCTDGQTDIRNLNIMMMMMILYEGIKVCVCACVRACVRVCIKADYIVCKALRLLETLDSVSNYYHTVCRFATVSCPLCRQRDAEVVMQRDVIFNQTKAQGIDIEGVNLVRLLNLDRVEDFANLTMLGTYVSVHYNYVVVCGHLLLILLF